MRNSTEKRNSHTPVLYRWAIHTWIEELHLRNLTTDCLISAGLWGCNPKKSSWPDTAWKKQLPSAGVLPWKANCNFLQFSCNNLTTWFSDICWEIMSCWILSIMSANWMGFRCTWPWVIKKIKRLHNVWELKCFLRLVSKSKFKI